MIRYAEESDIEQLLLLALQMHAESRYSALEFSIDKTYDFFMSCISNPDYLLLVAEEDGQLIGGFAGYTFAHYCSDDICAGDFALYMQPDKRGGFAAYRLIKLFMGWAKMKGAKLIHLGTTTGIDAEGVAKLYERIGFKQVGGIFSFRSRNV